jgi:hypothetical protein
VRLAGKPSGLRVLCEGAIVTAAYAVLAIVLMAPLFSDLGGATLDPRRAWLSGWYAASDHDVQAGAMLRDVRLFVWVYAWNWHALWTQPAAWFQANIFHPAPDALAYSEHTLGKLPVTGLLQAASGNPVFAYQADLLLCFALSGAAMYALVRHLGARRAAAFLAGLVYALAPIRRESLHQTYLLAGQYFPLVLLFLDRTLVGARWRDAAALAVVLLLHCAASYYLAYQAIVVLPVCLVAGWLWRRRTPLPGLVPAAIASAAAGIGFAALSVPYLRVRAGGGVPSFAGAEAALRIYSNDTWRSYLLPPWLLHAGIGPALERGAHAYLGALVVLLAALGLARAARIGEAAARLRGAAAAIVLVSWVMALGPVLVAGERTIPLPYDFAMRWIPGFDSMRVPYRFALLLMAGVAVLAGLGLELLLRSALVAGRPARAAALVAAVLVLTCLDTGLGTERYPTRPLLLGARGPAVYRALARLPRGPVVELPFTRADGLRASEYMVHSTTHWLPMLHGSSGYAPRSQAVLRPLTLALPDPGALALLVRMTGLRYVIVHSDALAAPAHRRWDAPGGLRLLGTYDGDRLYEVTDPPAADLLDAVRECARTGTTCASLQALVPA